METLSFFVPLVAVCSIRLHFRGSALARQLADFLTAQRARLQRSLLQFTGEMAHDFPASVPAPMSSGSLFFMSAPWCGFLASIRPSQKRVRALPL